MEAGGAGLSGPGGSWQAGRPTPQGEEQKAVLCGARPSLRALDPPPLVSLLLQRNPRSLSLRKQGSCSRRGAGGQLGPGQRRSQICPPLSWFLPPPLLLSHSVLAPPKQNKKQTLHRLLSTASPEIWFLCFHLPINVIAPNPLFQICVKISSLLRYSPSHLYPLLFLFPSFSFFIFFQ